MRDLLNRLSEVAMTGSPYTFLQGLTKQALTESQRGDPAANFPILGEALKQLTEAQSVVSEAMHTYMKVEAIKLSKQFRDAFVVLSGGMGSLNIEIIPSADYAARLDQMWDSTDVELENQADDFRIMVADLNETSSRAPFAPFVVNETVAQQYGVNSWELGYFVVRNGQQSTIEAATTHLKTLSSIVQRASKGH